MDEKDILSLYLKGTTKQGGYSAKELASIYELGKLFLEMGDIHKAEAVFVGLTNVEPDFALPWMGLTCIYFQNGNIELALQAAQQAYSLNSESIEIILFLVCCFLTAGDYNAAGTYLGEVTDKIEAGVEISPNLMRFYRMQLVRFQSRM